MKYLLFFIVVLSTMFISSCKKDDSDVGTDITFNNHIFTDINITLNGTTKTISPSNSVTFYSVTGSSVSYSAYTMGKSPSGSQIGLKLVLNNTLTLSGESISCDLNVSSDYFFLYITNAGNGVLHDLYVNYGLSSQTYDNILIPNDSIKHELGYYEAFTDSNIRMTTLDNAVAVRGFNFNLPWTENQTVHVTFGTW